MPRTLSNRAVKYYQAESLACAMHMQRQAKRRRISQFSRLRKEEWKSRGGRPPEDSGKGRERHPFASASVLHALASPMRCESGVLLGAGCRYPLLSRFRGCESEEGRAAALTGGVWAVDPPIATAHFSQPAANPGLLCSISGSALWLSRFESLTTACGTFRNACAPSRRASFLGRGVPGMMESRYRTRDCGI